MCVPELRVMLVGAQAVTQKMCAQVMEKCHCDLSDMIERPFTEVDMQQRQSWAMQIAEAMNYCHTLPNPVMHRDLKPENVLLTHDNQVG